MRQTEMLPQLRSGLLRRSAKRLPSKEIELETKDGVFYFFKADILSNQITYSTDKSIPANLVTISGRRAFEVIGLNKRGIKPESLLEETHRTEPKKPVDLLEQESLTRFDRNRKNKNSGDGNNGNGNGNNGGNRNKKKKKTPNNRPQSGEQAAAPQQQEQPRQQGDENGRKEMKDVHNGIATTVNVLTTTSPNLREINLLKMTSLLKNKTKTLRYIILLFIVSALGACDKQTVYHAFQSIPQEGWKRQDTLLFNVAVPDSQTYYKLIVEIRNRSTYPYQNINLSIYYDSPELKSYRQIH